MKNVNLVELQHYQQDYLAALKKFRLPKEQAQFTAYPAEKIETLIEGQHPIVILSNEEPVGFFILHSNERVKDYTDNGNAMLLTAFSINHSQQGKGFAKVGMSLLKTFVQKEFPTCNEIVLAVNAKNIPAQKLYEKVGYIDTDQRKMGKIGEQLILHLPLND